MTNDSTVITDLDYADKLWRAADTLRGQVDAAEYKHVVLGLLFLKYISDSFEARRDELRGELEAEGIGGAQLERLLESRDEYTAERVFWVPPEARWVNLQNLATRPDIATLIDDAILAVERDNSNLKGKLPRDYARRGIAPERMKYLIDLFAGIGFKDDRASARDMLGRVYEYFLGKFAQAEGKLGGDSQDWVPDYLTTYFTEVGLDFPRLINDDFFEAAKVLWQREKYISALKLTFSAIDTLGFIEFGDVDSCFINWLKGFCALEELGVTAEELWELRNSLLQYDKSGNRERCKRGQ